MANTAVEPPTPFPATHERGRPGSAALLDRLPVPLRLARPWLLRSNTRENRDAWARLKHASERPRYDAVRRVTERYAAHGFVLDVGCSRGLLRQGLRYARYEGIDSHPAAINAARATSDHEFGGGATRFVVADGAAYTPVGAPDVVVLTEVLYYLPDPLASALHYARLLTPCGALVVTASARSWTSTRLLRRLTADLAPLEHHLVTSGSLTWRIIAFAAANPYTPIPITEGLPAHSEPSQPQSTTTSGDLDRPVDDRRRRRPNRRSLPSDAPRLRIPARRPHRPTAPERRNRQLG